MKWILAATAAACTVAAPGAALAHTEPDLIAVPAGSASTVHLKPTHGCGESPTVARPHPRPLPRRHRRRRRGVDGHGTPDGAGNTVLEWTGGPLPADEDGAFPVQFTAPDTAGAAADVPRHPGVRERRGAGVDQRRPGRRVPGPTRARAAAGIRAGDDARRRPARRAGSGPARRRRRRRQPERRRRRPRHRPTTAPATTHQHRGAPATSARRRPRQPDVDRAGDHRRRDHAPASTATAAPTERRRRGGSAVGSRSPSSPAGPSLRSAPARRCARSEAAAVTRRRGRRAPGRRVT